MSKFKKIFFCKKAIALEIVVAILLGLVSWYFINKASNNFSSDVDMSLIGGQQSTMLEAPTDGSKPDAHDPKNNIYYALSVLDNADSFTASSSGDTVTTVAVMQVSQKIKAYRIVNGDEVFKESLSHSQFKGVGVRSFIKNGNYVLQDATSVTSIDNVVWSDKANKVSEDSYIAKYGYVPNGITAYLFSDETILESEYLGVENGIYSFRYTLDNEKAPAKLALEMRTMAGTASLPIFERISLTIRMDQNWQVTQTVTDCTYKVDMLGGVTCTEAVTENFTDFNKGVEIPNAEFYRGYLDKEIVDDVPQAKDPTTYLMDGFADYIMGQKPLKVNLSVSSTNDDLPLSVSAKAKINIDMNDLSALSAFISLDEINYDGLKINDIGVAYKNGEIFLRAQDFKGKASISDLGASLGGLLGTLGVQMPDLSGALDGLDVTSILSNATLKVASGKASVVIPLSLGDLSLTAKLNFTDGEKVAFESASVEAFGLNVSLTPDESIEISENLDGYNDITTILDLIDQNGNIPLELDVNGINAKVNFNLATFALDLEVGDIMVKYADGVVYFNYKDVKAKFDIDDIDTVIAKLTPILSGFIDASTIQTAVSAIDVVSILDGALSNLTAVEENDVLTISTSMQGVALAIKINTTDDAYTLNSISVDADKISVNVRPYDGVVSTIKESAIGQYFNVTPILDLIDNDGNIALDISVNGISAKLKINLINLCVDLELDELKAKYLNGVVYLNYKDVKAKFDIDDIDTVIAKLTPILDGKVDLSAIASLLPAFDLLDVLDQLVSTVDTSAGVNATTISTTVYGVEISITLNAENGEYSFGSVNVKADGLDLCVRPLIQNVSVIPEKSLSSYNDILGLLDVIDEQGNLTVSINLNGISANAKINLINFEIDVELGELKAKFVDDVVYVNYKDLKAKFEISDINAVLNKLTPILSAHGIDLSALGSISTIDFTSIISDAIANLDTSAGVNTVKIQTAIGNVVFGATLNTTDNRYTLNSIDLSVNGVELSVIPFSGKVNQIRSSSLKNYGDIVPLLDIIDTNNDITLTVDIGDISATVRLNLITLVADIELGELKAKYADGVIYINYKDINAKLLTKDIKTVLDKLSPILSAHVKDLDLNEIFDTFAQIDVKAIFGDLLNNISTSSTADGVIVSTVIMGIPLDITLSTANGKLSIANIGGTFEGTTISIKPTNETVTAIDDELLGTFSDIVPLLDIIDQNNDITLTVNIGDISATVRLNLITLVADIELGELKAKYADGVIYINYKDINAKLLTKDIKAVLDKLSPILSAHVKDLDLNEIFDTFAQIDVKAIFGDLLNNISTSSTADGVIVSTVIMGIPLDITLSTADGKLSIANIGGTFEGATISIKPTNQTVTAIDSNLLSTFNDIVPLLDIIDTNNDITLDLSITIAGEEKDTVLPVSVKLNLITLNADITASGLLDGLQAEYSNTNSTVYINYKGLKVKLATADLNVLLDKLAPILSANIDGFDVDALMNSFTNINASEIFDDVLNNLTTLVDAASQTLTISTALFGFDLDLVLSTVGNAYTINNIAVDFEGTPISVIPSAENISSLDDTTFDSYSDIIPLLDIIDSNNSIHVVVSIDDFEITASINLATLKLTAYIDGLELSLDLNTMVALARYDGMVNSDGSTTYGVLAKVNLKGANAMIQKIIPLVSKFDADIGALLEDLDLDAITSFDVEKLLSTITVSYDQNADVAVITLDINGVKVAVNLSTANGGLALNNAVITMGDTEITASIADVPHAEIVFDETLAYSDVNVLVDTFADLLAEILYADQLYVTAGGSFTMGASTFTITNCEIKIDDINTAPRAHATVTLSQTTTNEDGTTTSTTHVITLIYHDPSLVSAGATNVYFTYNNSADGDSKLEGTFTTEKAATTLDILKEIYKQMPELQDALKPIIVPDENGYPVLPTFDFTVPELINTLSFDTTGLLSGFLDLSCLMENLPTSIGAEIRNLNGVLNANIPAFRIGDVSLGLNANISKPASNVITDSIFNYTVSSNASDFSSINELLETLSNTASGRSFYITGKIGLAIGSLNIGGDNAIELDIKLDVVDDLTYAKVTIKRKHISVLFGAIQAWCDYDGESTLYYDPVNNLIHTEIKYRDEEKKNFGSFFKRDYKEEWHYEYATYTPDQFMSDAMNNILGLVRLNESWENMIVNAEPVDASAATIENTLLKYAYNGSTFTINLDLAPLIGDIGKTNVYITHDSSMNISSLTADAKIVNVLSLNLSANLASRDQYQSVKETLASEMSNITGGNRTVIIDL